MSGWLACSYSPWPRAPADLLTRALSLALARAVPTRALADDGGSCVKPPNPGVPVPLDP